MSLGITRRQKTHRGRKGGRDRFNDNIKFGMLNCRSVRNKTTQFHEFVLDHRLDFTCVCETWLTTSDDAATADLCPRGYLFKHHPRSTKRAGGVGFLYKDSLHVDIGPTGQFDTFESLSGTLSHPGSKQVDIIVVYRPPGFQGFSQFLIDFSAFVDERLCNPFSILITGDLNIHLDKTSSPHTLKFLDLISSHGLSQLVTSPTHDKGHILDVVLVRNSDKLPISKPNIIPGISDHAAITCVIRSCRSNRVNRAYTSRNIKDINRKSLIEDVAESNIISPSSVSENIDSATNRYNTILNSLLDIHAPAKTRKVRDHRDSPWYNSEITVEKRKRRQLERRWRSNGKLCIDRQMFQAQREVVNHLVESAKKSYYVGLINMCGNDTKKLYSTANRLLNRKQDSLLPRHTDSQELAQRFIHFFHSKIHKIQNSLTPDLTPVDPVTSASFHTIRSTTPDEIKSLLRRLPAKSCHLDPINTVLIKECSSTFASIITYIVNLSIDQACVPSVLKTAHILPILKKPNLDPQPRSVL
ncbi:uncharacterized protein LOC121405554 [Lytechinus variegatus]|uniref:uncharacterized protein LOC121405554 n=1 Tax=Lytechinus variegatus TaxID=7654 RepID=UPI001BB135D5|nr:uncharacterized protein LOC121405554 [Lytechinus variegatus]